MTDSSRYGKRDILLLITGNANFDHDKIEVSNKINHKEIYEALDSWLNFYLENNMEQLYDYYKDDVLRVRKAYIDYDKARNKFYSLIDFLVESLPESPTEFEESYTILRSKDTEFRLACKNLAISISWD